MILRFFYGAALQGVAFFVSVACYSLNLIFPSQGWLLASVLASLFCAVIFLEEFRLTSWKERLFFGVAFLVVAIAGGFYCGSR